MNIDNSNFKEIKTSFPESIEPDKQIINFIASEIRISNRELIGSLNRIISFSRIYSKLHSFVETKIILKDLLNFSENKVTIENIQKIVCNNYKISKNEMLSPRRSRYLVRPRQIAMYLAKTLTSKSILRALTTDNPTPCSPPEVLYIFSENFPPACNVVKTTSKALLFL